MKRSGVLGTAKRIIMSKFFLISMLLWLLFSFLLTVFAVGSVSSSTINQFSIPDSQISHTFDVSGNAITFYAQNFNSYGDPISGTSAYYNLSGNPLYTGSQVTHITGGYAGKTNATGFVNLSLSDIQIDYGYFLDVHYFNPGTDYNLNALYYISTAPSTQTTNSDGVAITPVKSSSDPGTFALHVWAFPGTTVQNATVFYEKGSSIMDFFSTPNLFNYNKTVTIANASISSAVNIQTGISLQGQPYFYAAGVNYSDGGIAGDTFFSTIPTPLLEAQQVSGFIFGVSFILIFFVSISAVSALSIREEYKVTRLEKLIPRGYPDDGTRGRATLFIHRILASLLLSIPVTAITVFFVYLSTITTFNITPGVPEILSYSSGMLISMMLATAYASILLGAGIILSLPRGDENYRKYTRRFAIFIYLLFPPLFFSLYMNMNGTYSSTYAPTLVVMNNFLDPFSYPYLILQRVNRSLFFGQQYSFNPSDYGITFASTLIMGIVWIAVWIVVPYLLFRLFPGKKLNQSTTSSADDHSSGN